MPGQGFLQFTTGIIQNENPTSSLASIQVMLRICHAEEQNKFCSLCIDCREVTQNLCLMNSVQFLESFGRRPKTNW